MPAARDLEAIVEGISQDSPGAARKALARIQRSATGIVPYPDRGRIVPELLRYGITTYRELIITPWRIVYRIAAPVVYVLVVIDGRRNVEDVLLDRLVRPPD